MVNVVMVVVLVMSILVDAICAYAIARKDKQTEFILSQARLERKELLEQLSKEKEELLLALISRETAVGQIISDKDGSSVDILDDYAKKQNFFPELQYNES